jgi:hypothetical protein
MAKEIEKQLLDGEKIELETQYKLSIKEESSFVSGFVGYITNKRVIFYKNKLFGFVLHDMAFNHLAGAAVTSTRDLGALLLGICLTLIGLLVASSNGFGMIIAVVGLGIIILWYLKPIETLTLKGAGVDLQVRANSSILYKLLKEVRSRQKI